ncbi:MAG TPA: N-acetyltransferase [Thermoanaerobaculia bacterium]|nr:N-acetyltransferase [Thermoanaerobaculia bacterium]
MRVREASITDLDSIAAIESAIFDPEPYPRFFLRQAHDLWGAWLLVAEDDSGGVAGYALAAPRLGGEEACILALAVVDGMRGRGVGARLLEALLERLAAHRVATAWLTVHPGNAPAIRLYERLGFVVAAEEAAYFGAGAPRLRMERKLL